MAFLNPATAGGLATLGPAGWVGIGVLGVLSLGAVYMAQNAGNANTSAGTLSPADTTTGCPTCPPDHCGPILARIRAMAEEVRFRHADLLLDRHNLFNTARRLRQAGPHGSWQGHINRFRQERSDLRYEIAVAESQGCIVDAESKRIAALEPPSRPGG